MTTKKEVLKEFINDIHAFLPKERDYLNNNFKDFCKFVEVTSDDVYDYSSIGLSELTTMKRNGLDGVMLKLIENKTGYIRRKFEAYCIDLVLSGAK